LHQITEDKTYDHYGGQALGIVEATFFPGKLRLKLRGIYRKTRFSEKEIPVLMKQPNIGSGFFYTLGFSVEI